MTFQLLVSALGADISTLPKTMNISSDAVIVNQCDEDREETLNNKERTLKILYKNERGVGRSRNAAMLAATSDICLFSDEDIVYDSDYEEKVLEGFRKYPDASVLLFNVDVDERRRTYFNEDVHRIKWNNYGRYPAYAIAIRRKAVIDNDIRYSELFGGGAKYSNGEDSLFLHDCLKKGLIIYSQTAVLGKETYRESTWFKGYTDKFFFDRGVLYHFLYGGMAPIFGLRFLIKNRETMLKDISLGRAYALLLQGIKEGKTI